jgi:hypothetical protein
LTFAFSIFQIIHTNGVILGREIKIRDAMILRVVSAFVAYLLLSLWYTLIQLSFGVPMTRYFGRGGVVLFWALNWCTMAAGKMVSDEIEARLTVDSGDSDGEHLHLAGSEMGRILFELL